MVSAFVREKRREGDWGRRLDPNHLSLDPFVRLRFHEKENLRQKICAQLDDHSHLGQGDGCEISLKT